MSSGPRLKPLKDAAQAFALLTVVPIPSRLTDEPPVRVSGWFPLVGLGLGALAWLLVEALKWVGWYTGSPLVVATMVVVLWAVVSRLLHWDALADTADAMWGGRTAQDRVRIMADSSVGAFGVTTVVLVAFMQVTTLASLPWDVLPIAVLVVPALSLMSASFAAWLGTPAKPGGLGAIVSGRPALSTALPAVLVVGAIAWLLWASLEVEGLALAGLAIVLALAVPHVLSRPVGGVTGDIMGASVLICETVLLLTAAAAWGA